MCRGLLSNVCVCVCERESVLLCLGQAYKLRGDHLAVPRQEGSSGHNGFTPSKTAADPQVSTEMAHLPHMGHTVPGAGEGGGQGKC